MFEALRERIALAVLPKVRKADNPNPYHVISTRPAGVPVYSDMTVHRATREGYKMSVYVFRAVRTIVQAASAIPWIVTDKNGEEIPDHQLTKVLKNPCPEFSGQDLQELKIAHLLLAGNALQMPIIVGRQVKELWPVMPDLVRPVPSDQPGEWLKGWEVTSYDGLWKLFPPDQFLHFMQMDPGNLHWGTSPLLAAARTVDTDNEAQDTQKISMQNRATPDGVFSHEVPLTPEQFEEARRQIRENYLAKQKKREPWVLGAGAKWNQMSMTPVEMDFIASRLQNKRDVAAAFGISPIFLGDLEQSSYNNMAEARKALYEDVVIPLLDDDKSTLNLKIAPLYGDIIIAYDTSKVAALREDFGKKVEHGKGLWAMGVPFQQINERLEMGFEEFPGWDVGYLPMMLVPTNSPAREEEAEKMSTKTLNLSTEEQKTIHWKRVDTRRVAWWGVVQKKFLPLYKAQGVDVDKAIKGKAPDKLLAAATKAIAAGRSDWEKMMTAVLTTIIDDFGSDTADDLGAEKSAGPGEVKWIFDPTTPAIRKWIAQHGAEDVVTMGETDLLDVRRVILAGVEANRPTTTIAQNLRSFYLDRSEFKAMRVARTEVTKASSYGSLEAAKQSKVVRIKTWLTSRDDRVRDEHIAMDGEDQKLDDLFSNGLDSPNEPMCRCVLTFKTGK